MGKNLKSKQLFPNRVRARLNLTTEFSAGRISTRQPPAGTTGRKIEFCMLSAQEFGVKPTSAQKTPAGQRNPKNRQNRPFSSRNAPQNCIPRSRVINVILSETKDLNSNTERQPKKILRFAQDDTVRFFMSPFRESALTDGSCQTGRRLARL